MWQLLTETGWQGSRVWEPGCGIGIFAAGAPEGVQVTGVELDAVTARLATRLHHPNGHHIIHGSLADVVVDGTFDAAIGNVPFADIRPTAASNPNRELALHNLAIRQAIRSVQLGSPVLVVTSPYTLDALNPAQRELLGSEARFLGAIRLPETAFRAHSGTDVTTDIVAFQRHPDDGEPEAPGGWIGTAEFDTPGHGQAVGSEWYQHHPDLVLGDIEGGGMYRSDSIRVVLPADEFPDRLREGMQRFAEVVDDRRHGTYPPASAPGEIIRSASPAPSHDRPEWIKPGGIYTLDGDFWRRPVGPGPDEPFTPKPAKDRVRLGHLIALRDTYTQLVDAEANDHPINEIEALRADLNRHYDRATKDGPLNEVRVTVNKNDVESRRRPPFGGMRLSDPDFATICGLEDYDQETGIATKAPIFRERQIRAPHAPSTVDTPGEAVTLSLHQTGRLDRARIAQLLDIDAGGVDDALDGHAFIDPDDGQLVARPLYLSGDVRTKLDIARLAARDDDRYHANVEALTGVVPDDLQWDDISVELGATWIKPSEVKAFIDQTFDAYTDNVVIGYESAVGWYSRAEHKTNAEAFIETWGTPHYHALDLVDAGLRNRAVKVYDDIDYVDTNGRDKTRQVLNRERTVEANQKLDEINLAFHEWLGSDPDRVVELTDRYNRLFRSHVPPDFSGDWPRPAGLVDHIDLRPHQAAAVNRLLLTGTVGLYHEVGAGKTLAMATSAMELRRLGIANRPMMVVPNHLVGQIAGEFLAAYPQAKLLVPEGRSGGTKGLSADDRRRFISQCASGDWDCVIVPEAVYLRIPVSSEVEAGYLASRVDEFREAIDAIKENGDKVTAKRVEKRVARLEERIKELLDSHRDPSLCFEVLGIDAMFVDEAHYYKNLEIVSGRSDLSVTPSQRAADLDLKLREMRSHHERSAFMPATGTPLSNSLHELWVMMRYTDPGLLEQLGIHTFDGWASQFARIITDYEQTPDGFKLKDRLAGFKNVPELQQIFRLTADVQLAEDLDLPRPAIVGGQAQHLLVPTNPALQAFISELEARSRSLPDDPRIDNRLKILTDYRKGAIDLRLVGWQAEPNKVTVAADGIADRYHAHKDRTYLDRRTGEPSPNPGSLQIVFLDAGIPGGSSYDLYNELRKELVDRGVPADRVTFIHEAKDPKTLFAACRDGRVSVLIGSTPKMGTGANVQDRATALWHLDPPWRPADVAQRDGRALRQGNQNDQVELIHVIQEGSGDALSYQGLERKRRMIASILTGLNTDRTIEDLDGDEITFGDLKALATGDPQVLELLRAKRTLGELEIARRTWERKTTRAKANIPGFVEAIGRAEEHAAAGAEALATLQANGAAELRPETRIGDQSVNQAIIAAVPDMGTTDPGRAKTIARVGDLPITARLDNTTASTKVVFGAGKVEILSLPRDEIKPTSYLADRLVRALHRLDQTVAQAERNLDSARGNLRQAETNATATFRLGDELDAARVAVAELEDALAAKAQAAADAAGEPLAEPSIDDSTGSLVVDLTSAPTPATGQGDQIVIVEVAAAEFAPTDVFATDPIFAEVVDELASRLDIQQQAAANTYETFAAGMDKRFTEAVAARFDQHTAAASRYLDDPNQAEAVLSHHLPDIYDQAKSASPSTARPAPGPSSTTTPDTPAPRTPDAGRITAAARSQPPERRPGPPSHRRPPTGPTPPSPTP